MLNSFSWKRLHVAITMCFMLMIALPVQAQDQAIYTDSLQNGWQNYGWATLNYNNSSPVKAGTASIRVDTANYSALFLHHDAFSTAPYTALSFWIHGGTTGNQSLQIQANVNGSALGAVVLDAPVANQWKQYIIPLTTLGVSNTTNFDGFWIQSRVGNAQPTFYVDEIKLVGVAVPSVVNLHVNANGSVRTVDNRIFGVNTAIWDSSLNSQGTIDLLTANDNRALRFPGGSSSDGYHFKTGLTDGSTYLWPGTFDGFANVATKTNAQVFITVNYGSGTAQEAADWVTYSNKTKNYGFKYWEIGNENYGSWENDINTRPHDPYTYATRAGDYITAMKGADPSIKVGVVVITGEDAWNTYTDHSATNSRTGQAHKGWTPILLSRLKELNAVPDYVIYHRYDQNPGNESDAGLLQSSVGWSSDITNLRQMLSDYYGPASSHIEIVCTENNSVSSNPGKQSTSLVNGLFMADSIGNALQTELAGLVWWDFRNGASTNYNNSASLYGWRQYGDYGLVSGTNDKYPTYYVSKLLKNFARGGDTILPASTDYGLLSVYAARRTNGTLSLLIINKSATNTLNSSVTFDGFVPTGTATTYAYGIAQDEAARTGTGSPDVATGTLAVGTGFTTAFPPYSVTVISLTQASALAAPSKLTATSTTTGQVNLAWTSNSTTQSGFQIERSTDAKSFTQVKTVGANVVSTSDSGLTSRQQIWYRIRAYNAAGNSAYSNIVTVRVR